MAELVVGPLLRYVSEEAATIWVETDGPCEVEILGRRERTFCIGGHHFALVAIPELEPGSEQAYEVALDGERVWPPEEWDFPPSTIRPIDPGARLRVVFGSCRVCAPHEPPYTLTKDEHEDGRGIDALYAMAKRMLSLPHEEWPDLLLMTGDQVYTDEDAPETREFIRARRDVSKPPWTEVHDFEEYTRLYRESWCQPVIRWLLSTVPSAMIFDDHDVHDDWNTSESWVEDMRAKPWWNEHIVSALMSYWVYQHIGNLSPSKLAEDEVYAEVRAADDGGETLRRFAFDADREVGGSRWDYVRDLGRTRIVMFDTRESRVLHDGKRQMFDDNSFELVVDAVTGDFDHLLLGDTLPLLLLPSLHHLEAWNEAVCDGAWGGVAARLGERIRRALDLEHWAAFHVSFNRLTKLIRDVATGQRGPAPATIVSLAGDVHHAYVAEVGFPRGTNAQSAVYQAVCSPFRNPLDSHERHMIRAANTKAAAAATRVLAAAAGVPRPDVSWRLVEDSVTFDNQFATVDLDGRRAVLRIEKAVPGDHEQPRLETTLERRLA